MLINITESSHYKIIILNDSLNIRVTTPNSTFSSGSQQHNFLRSYILSSKSGINGGSILIF